MKRLLFIAHRVPYPPDKGERVRAFHEIRALAEPFRVTLAALTHSPDDRRAARGLEPWCERVVTGSAGGPLGLARGALALVRGGCVTEGYFRSPRLARRLQDVGDGRPFDVVLAYCSAALPYALAVPTNGRVADLVDIDSAKWAAYAEAARWPTSWLYRREARGVQRLEQQALCHCDAVVLVSRAEAQALGAESDKVLAVGNGVDTDYFRPQDRPAEASPALVFTGTMDYRPNVEGVCWFAEAIWPALARERPDLRFVIVGRDPTPAVRRLAARPGIEVTGAVPDVRPYLARATLAVAPLLTARGIQNKVLEAMAMGRAVVASPAALEGLDVETGAEVVEAQPPDEWQREILDLLENDARRQAIERAARSRIENRFRWERQMKPLVDCCLALSGASERGPGTVEDDGAARAAAPPSARDVTVPRAEE
jgi:sugar transferase (PEP-CTERM/EpsH1 system associated)